MQCVKNAHYKVTPNKFMKIQLLFPIILIVLDLLASVVYFIKTDPRLGIYWIAAAVLTICVTFK
jgi:hypothetical protein